MDAAIGADESVVGGKHCPAVATGKCRRSSIAGRDVGIGIKRGDSEVIGGAGNHRLGETADLQEACCRRVDRNARLRAAGHPGVRGIFGRQQLAAGRLQSRQEGMDPRIGAGKRVVRRQDRLAVSAAEGHGICKSRRRVAKHILSGDLEALDHSGGGLGGEVADGQMVRRRRVDGNP